MNDETLNLTFQEQQLYDISVSLPCSSMQSSVSKLILDKEDEDCLLEDVNNVTVAAFWVNLP